MSFVKMPQDDYVAMCNKLRSMLNETDKYTSKDFIEKMDELIVDIEEGGNPNYVETIEGTLANPWGNIDPSELQQSVLARNASVEMDIDATELGFGHIYLTMEQFLNTSLGIGFTGVLNTGIFPERWTALIVGYTLNGLFQEALLLQAESVTAMGQQASAAPTTLTIIHHPLPSQS